MSKTWDLIHGEVLFAHQAKPNKRVYLWEEDLAELESVLEPMPRSLLQRSQLPDSTAYSGSKGRLIPFHDTVTLRLVLTTAQANVLAFHRGS
jgi:hypothetical protein